MFKVKKKVTWNDLHESDPNDVKKHYKLGVRELEQQVRSHLDGADRREMETIYRKFYDRRR